MTRYLADPVRHRYTHELLWECPNTRCITYGQDWPLWWTYCPRCGSPMRERRLKLVAA